MRESGDYKNFIKYRQNVNSPAKLMYNNNNKKKGHRIHSSFKAVKQYKFSADKRPIGKNIT